MENPWKILSQKEIYDNKWINVTQYDVINPAGGKGIYGKIHFKNLAIGIVAIDEKDTVYLVGQYRFAIDQYSVELPEGGCAENEDPLEAAKRELLEETGLKAENWEMFLQMHLSNSVTDELAIVYLATGLSQHESDLEDTEDISVIKMPFNELVKKVVSGEITDTITVTAILKLAYLRIVKQGN